MTNQKTYVIIYPVALSIPSGYGGTGRHAGLRNLCESVGVRVPLSACFGQFKGFKKFSKFFSKKPLTNVSDNVIISIVASAAGKMSLFENQIIIYKEEEILN